MNLPRKILKSYLSFLSRLAIRRHSMELIIIVGWHGTEIVREAIYEILNEKFHVRRNTKNLWWDLSVPLTILGYKDKKRSVVRWLWLCIRALFYLLFGRRSPHKIVLNLNTSDENTVEFWSKFIRPEYLVIVNQKESTKLIETLIKNTEKNMGKIIYDPSMSRLNVKKTVGFTFGEGRNVKLKVADGKTAVTYKYKNETVKFSYSILPKFSSILIGSSLSFAVLKGMTLVNAGFAALKVNSQSRLISKIISNI